jgi:dTMP kinase
MPLRKPLFVVFEGIDGSGKSTACAELEKILLSRSEPCVRFAEPTQGSYGLKIRSLLAEPIKPDPDVMLELFIRDREEDAALNLTPSAAEGRIVLLDRYYYSNAAYQGASGISFSRILKVNARYGFPVPDRVYLFDIDPALALARVSSRNDEQGGVSDAFEKEPFLRDVRELYLKMADERFLILDASAGREQIIRIVLDDLERNFTDEQ